MSSRRRAKVTIRPKRLTADAIPRTLGTPNFCLKIGRRETPKVAPSLATPAANPPVLPRNCVGNNIGASVTVVELRPAFISRLNRMNPANTKGMCKLEFVRPTAANNIKMPTAIPAKPMACTRMRRTVESSRLQAFERSKSPKERVDWRRATLFSQRVAARRK